MIYKIKLLLLTISVAVCSLCKAQINLTEQDSVIFKQYITELAEYGSQPINERLTLTGKYFLDKPYVAATLESEGGEQLTINLREFDCTTFVENCIALSHELQKGDSASFDAYKEFLKEVRYRNGAIDGYTSRLHYASDWLYENKDLLDNVTLELGGNSVEKPLSFMSSKSDLYPSLKTNTDNRKKIQEIESTVNKRNNYTLLPVSKIKQAKKLIKTGDIIIFGTGVQGLDYSHIGIALWEGNVLRLLHASSAKKKVIVDPKTLVEYCTGSKTCTGITILRLKNK